MLLQKAAESGKDFTRIGMGTEPAAGHKGMKVGLRFWYHHQIETNDDTPGFMHEP